MTAYALPASALRSTSDTACWCCEREIGPGARRCRHCGVPLITAPSVRVVAPAHRTTPTSVRIATPTRSTVLEPAPSLMARPVGPGALLLSAVGLLSWFALLAM